MIQKIETAIAKFKLCSLMVFWIIFMMFKSSIGTLFDWFLAKIPTEIIEKGGDLVKIISMTAIISLIFVIIMTVARIFGKTSRLKLFNYFRNKLQAKMFTCNISDLMQYNVGKLSSNINIKVENEVNIIEICLEILNFAIPTIVVLIQLYNYTNGFVVLANIIFIFILAILFKLTNTDKKLEKIHASNREVMGIVSDNIYNIKTLRYLNKADFAEERLVYAQENSVKENVAIWRKFSQSLLWLSPTIAVLFDLYYLRNCTEPQVLIFISGQIFGTLSNLASYLAEIIGYYQEYSMAKKDLEFLNKKSERKENPINKGIEVNSEFGYKDSDVIFKAKLFFEKNKRYSIQGESGQGKSTLANLLAGVLTPLNGFVDNVKTFYIHQETEILDSSLRDNLCFGKKISEEKLLYLLERIGLLEWFKSLPNGFETVLGDRGNKVSSGQKQRLNILRAILQFESLDENTLVILDEPTSNLDCKSEKLAISLIDEYCKSTLIVVTHRPAIADICDYHIKVTNHTFSLID